jgi:diacylglycerol kinase family enzyme
LSRILLVAENLSGEDSAVPVAHRLQRMLSYYYKIINITWINHQEDIQSLQYRLMEKDYEIIAFIGSDTIFTQTAQFFIKINTPIAFIPSEDKSAIAHSLLLPHQLDQCVRMIKFGKDIAIDAGLFDNTLFLCSANAGIFTKASYYFETGRRDGMLAYVDFISAIGYSTEFIQLKIEYEEGVKDISTPFIMIQNTTHTQRGFQLCPTISHEDGKLNFFFLEKWKPIKRIQKMRKIFGNDGWNMGAILDCIRGERLFITPVSPLLFNIDGQYRRITKRTMIKCLPTVLNLRIPNGQSSGFLA